MIVQSNVAQPQIIQQTSPLDTFLARLTAASQLGANILQGYSFYNTGKQAEASKLSEAMKFALTLNDDEGIAYLQSVGAPAKMIQQFQALKGTRLAQKAFVDIDRARNEALANNKNGGNMQGWWGATNAALQGKPYKAEAPAMEGSISSPHPLIQIQQIGDSESSVPVLLPGAQIPVNQSPFPSMSSPVGGLVYTGPVQKTPYYGYYDETKDYLDFLTDLSGSVSLQERNPFA